MKPQIVEVEKIRKLRHRVLRKGRPFTDTLYERDNDKQTIHLAIIKREKTLTCATFYPEKTTEVKSKKAYRLRGMATDPFFRRKGYGRKIMKESFEILKKQKCDVLWCNARLVAVKFYLSLGFKKKGEIFNIKSIGPHYYMYKKIT